MPTWKPSLAIGIPAVDQQHKELFTRADALLTAMSQGKPADETRRLLGFLDDYCTHHFATEEKLMRDRRYPGLTEHAAQHQHFVAQFRGITAQFEEKGPAVTVAIAIQKLVCGWLVQHIGSTDAKIAAFLVAERSKLSA